MKRAVLLMMIFGVARAGTLFGQAASDSSASDQSASEAAIRKMAASYVAAFNQHDAKALADHWSPDAVYLNRTTGEEVVGRPAIAEQFKTLFQAQPELKLQVDVESVQFISPNVAVERGSSKFLAPNAEPDQIDYTAINVKRDGKWLLDRVTDKAGESVSSHHEQLKELEWMVGQWTSGTDNADIEVDCNWTKNQSFLTRTFKIVVDGQTITSGIQLIGWDPAAKAIRSWTFDANGTFAEATWQHSGGSWYLRNRGTLADGRPATMINVMKQIDADAFTWETIERTAGGELLPNINEIQIVPPLRSLWFHAHITTFNHAGATMKRGLAIVLAGGILTVGMQLEVLARGGGGGSGGGRGGGGGGGAARSGGGFAPSGGSARPAAASPRPSAGGGQAAAARPAQGRAPAAPAKGAVAAQRPAQGAAAAQRPAQGAAAAQRPVQGAAAAQRPAQGAAAARPAAGNRPTAGQVGNFLDVPGGAGGAAVAAGAVAGAGRAGGAAGDFLQGGAAPLAAAGAATGRARGDAGRPGTAGENLAQNRPERIENRGERQGTRDQRRDEVRNQYEQNNPGSFWEQNPGWAAFAVTRPLAWASWGSVGSWCGYGSEPTSYNYGENVYYAGDQVYAGDQPVATAEEYTEQAAAIANSTPSETPGKADWLPLGVFALTQDGQASGAAPSLYMQLALSKQGVISGTLKNTLTGIAQSLEGMADKKSQRVAWCVVDQQRPIIETGLENLTKDSSAALVHFADGQTQQWLMVRMPEEKQ